METAIFMHEGHRITIIRQGIARCAVVDQTAYILKPSSSRYRLRTPDGNSHQFVCLDKCCEAGVSEIVRSLAEEAVKAGAELIVLRTGLIYHQPSRIVGIPVQDVSEHSMSGVRGMDIIS